MKEIRANYFFLETGNDDMVLIKSWRFESPSNVNACFDAKKIGLETPSVSNAPVLVLDKIFANLTPKTSVL